MNVKELIEYLKNYPPTMKIRINTNVGIYPLDTNEIYETKILNDKKSILLIDLGC